MSTNSPMFDRLRWQLLFSYLSVLIAILGVFAIAVRLVFGYSLRHSLSQELMILAEVAATHAEIQNNRMIIGDEFTDRNLTLPDRKFEWFDRQKRLVDKVGNLNVNFPLNIDPPVQFNKYPGQNPDETISAIVPITSNDNRQQIGYVRITQSLDPLVGGASPTENRTFHQLDIGLASGMIISILISGGAGIWLTRRAMKPAVTSYHRLQQYIKSKLSVKGYIHSLDRVFINLIENAISYTPLGGIINIIAQRIERQIEIGISDTGVGIAPDDLERIFDRFWRGDRARTRWEGGSGLGLAIVKSIDEQHDGSIEVQSEFGEGSKFIVRLPTIFVSN